MKRYLIIFLWAFAALTCAAQGSATYDKALADFGLYRDRMAGLRAGTPQYEECRTALRAIFPQLCDGAYHYAGLGRQDKVLDFACAYVDISLLPAFAGSDLQSAPSFPILANLAATNIYNRGDYMRAMDYFKAYLNTTDTENRELAFEGLARCYYELRDYDRAAYIASQGTLHYPTNWNMLIIGIESYGNGGNDAGMAPMLERALALNPGHKGLLEYKGKLQERQKDFAGAAATFGRLYGINGSSLDYACHYAFNLYNAATVDMQASKAPGISRAAAAGLERSAREGFGKAAPVLRDVLDNTPYAANVARALAMCYSMTNDAARLREANTTLTALRVSEIRGNEIPTVDLSYRPTVELSPVAPQVADATPLSDVDINIPVTTLRNDKTYVVIIGNENYKHHAKVNYAQNDGRSFAEYCRKVLGVPDDNIRQYYDATLAELREPMKYLSERTAMSPGELKVIFYYAGHGIPDVTSGSSYLLPSDATGTDFESCYSLEKLCDQFDAMPAQSVTVFLDACFSGATRSSGMLFAERFVEYEVEDLVAKGNTVVFSATTGKQTAMGYDEQNHGFFTYYLLKTLQESRGNITLGSLADRLRRDVDAKAYDKKNKHQTPTVSPSPALGDVWRTRTLL